MTNAKIAGRAREEVLLRKMKKEQTLFLSSDKCHKKNMTNDTIILAHNGYNIYNNEQRTTNETTNSKNLYNQMKQSVTTATEYVRRFTPKAATLNHRDLKEGQQTIEYKPSGNE